MKNNKIFLSLYIGYASYTLLLVFFGGTGMISMSKYENYKNELIEDNRHLENEVTRLRQELELLENDREEIRLRSRTLGLYSEAERVISVEKPVMKENASVPAKKTVFAEKIVESGPQFRTVGVAISLMVYIILLFFMREGNASEKKRSGNIFQSS